MIQVITVEREYGSRGGEFARLLAEHLKWNLLDQSLIDEVAKRAGVPAAEARAGMSAWIPGTARWDGRSGMAATSALPRYWSRKFLTRLA